MPMRAVLDFPIKHIDQNLVFGKDGTVTAYYRISGFNYDFLDHDDKFIPFVKQRSFLENNSSDLHFILEPFPTNVEEIIDNTIAEIKEKDYLLRQSGIRYLSILKDTISKQKNITETSENIQYIGIQLNPQSNRYEDSNYGTSAFKIIKEFLKGLNSPVNKAVGLHATDILTDEILAWKQQAEIVRESLASAYNCLVQSATQAECIYLIEKETSVSPSNNDVEVRHNYTFGEKVRGMNKEGMEHEAVRPHEMGFVELQDANIEEISPTSLLISKIIEDKEKKLYTRYFVAKQLNTENYFPGFEWLYHLQSKVPFPVSVSIRAYYQSNKLMLKKLSDKRLEYQDQREEANKAGSSTDLSLNQSEKGTIQAESLFSKTGIPAYSCSFVFKVSAESEKELEIRSRRLKDELSTYGIKIVAPYGEQLNLMMEKLPGSRQINNDYKIEVESGVLSGMMFGATTNIGDNRGFFIGYTERLQRPVFIQPDLAAKSFEGLNNIEDSISALVAGATGKGKSFFMNLYTYLSVLTGSQALIIDPKGDRKGWNSLPMIPSEYISKWTLGADRKDAGCLDPFRTSVDVEEGKNHALDILSYLVGVDIQDIGYTILSDAVEQVKNMPDPCIGAVISYLENQYENPDEKMSEKRFTALETIKNTLVSLKRQSLSLLLFGEVGQDYNTMKIDKPIQILMVQNLNLPDGSSEKLRPSEKISEAILISITAFTKQYMFTQDRSRHKVILQDEASAIDNTPVGRELMNFIVRMGRYYNTTLLKGSQNATDHNKDVANIGMKFSFGLRTKQEAMEMLEFLNLPQTNTNINRIRNMSKGNCLFQDIYGRSAIIQIDPVFADLAKAFDSSTSTEEERERERKRRGYVNQLPDESTNTEETPKEQEGAIV
ncbi:ATP-binding protein [Niallia endozanthoxylica]|nr:ATP-binding protein [Niallia endozanthoxylica]